jgi:4'-phosphopantetheinyl transferase
MYALLDAGERARAERFRRPEDRRSFVAARAALRTLLGAALGADAADFTFAVNAFGKPQLTGSPVAFNVSHSGHIALIALTSGVDVGVDVEHVRIIPERADLARRFFHVEEAAELASVPEGEANAAFFRCWTRKEAVAKALGLGLNAKLDRYRVSCSLEPALLIACEGSPPAASWSLFHLAPAHEHVGAIALPQRPTELISRSFDLASCA